MKIEKEVKKAFGSVDPIIIGRKLRWAAGRDLLKELKEREKERFKYKQTKKKNMKRKTKEINDPVEFGIMMRREASRRLLEKLGE
jgi:hypothetical protein